VVLQSFLHNPILRNFYLSDGHASSNCNVQYCLSCAMDDMFQDFYALENTNGYTAANILSGFWFSGRRAFDVLATTNEQDAHEFFQFLAEELHERNGDGKKPEIGSEHSCHCIIHQTFYGKLQTTTTCQNCSGVTNQVQSFLDLSLPLENLGHKKGKKGGGAGRGALTLQECLDEEYIKSDKCEYRCHNCSSMQQARRQTTIKRLPNVLSIQLKVCLCSSSPGNGTDTTPALRVQARPPRARGKDRHARALPARAQHAPLHQPRPRQRPGRQQGELRARPLVHLRPAQRRRARRRARLGPLRVVLPRRRPSE
jgi:ubiquitin C-terminal hydrolase